MREAILDHLSFNAIHLESMFKVDFFVLGNSESQNRVADPGPPRSHANTATSVGRSITRSGAARLVIRYAE